MTMNQSEIVTATDKVRKAHERGIIDDATFKMEMARIEAECNILPSDTVDEPITIGFKVKESDGSQVLHMDGYSVAAVDGGYDALRAANIAKANDDTESAKAALGIVEACQDRAKVAAKALIADAGKRAAECMKPGGKAAERDRMRLCLKAALRATRVGYKRK